MNRRVLVVGAGPVGLTLALQLKRFGVPVDLIERGSSAGSYSKALSLNAASLKAFHGLSLQEEIAQAGKAISDIYLYSGGRRFSHIDKHRLGGLYDYYLSLPQPRTEEVLREKLCSLGGVVHYGHELVHLRQIPGGVEATIRALQDNRTDLSRYDFIVGCDGAHSTVRELSGIAFSGSDYGLHFVMGDVAFEGGRHQVWTTYHLWDDGFLIFLPMDNGLTRLVVGRRQPLPAGRPKPAVSELQGYLDRYHGQGFRIASLAWSSSAPIFTRLASGAQEGRVFLAGDALHLFSPIGGQGMNTGIQDAVNLGWKLAYYMRGLAGRRLLNSYAEERLLAVERVEHCTSEHTRAIFGLEKHGPVHDLYRPGFANRRSLRDIVAQQFSGLAFDHSVYGSMVGRHVPFFPVNSPTMEVANSYDLPRTGRHAILVPEGTDVSKLAKMRARWGHVSQSYTLDSDGCQVVTAARPGEVCLVRPDGFIGFSGNLEECERHLERVHSILDGEGGRSALGIQRPLRPAMTTESHARPADIRDAVRMPTVRREIQALHSPSVQPPITPPDDRSHAMALASRQNCKPTSD